jgi:hypothetical protein
MSAMKIIQALGRKIAAKKAKTPEGITQIQPQIYAEAEAGGIAQTLVDSGLPMNKFDEFIKSEKDLLKYLNIIESVNKPRIRVIDADSLEGKGITEALFGKKGEVFSLQGEKLDPNLPISGGTQQGKKINRKFFERDAEAKQLQKRIDSGVAATVEKILAMEPLDAMKEASSVIGRKGIYKNLSEQDAKKILQDTEDHIFDRVIKVDEFDPDIEDFAEGGVAGMLGERQNYDNGGDVYLPPIKDVEMGLRFKPDNDFPIGYLNEDILKQIIKNPKQGLEDLQLSILKKNYDDKSKLEFMLGKDNAGIRFSKRFAEGGPARQNFKMGRRAFLKMLAGTGAGIAGLKTGITGLGGKKVATEVAKEAVTTSGGTPPPYFFNLIKKIKNLGDDVTSKSATTERQKVTKYKDYELTEDLTTGEQTIQKKSFAEPDEGLTYENKTEEVYMNYKPGKGQADETTGKSPL